MSTPSHDDSLEKTSLTGEPPSGSKIPASDKPTTTVNVDDAQEKSEKTQDESTPPNPHGEIGKSASPTQASEPLNTSESVKSEEAKSYSDEQPAKRPVGSSAPNTPPLELPLQNASVEYWQSLDEQERIVCYDMIAIYFGNLLEDFRNSANEAVSSHSRFSSMGKSWRLRIICLTGGLAILNVLATS
jgi:hypothetical protein